MDISVILAPIATAVIGALVGALRESRPSDPLEVSDAV